MNAVFFKAAAFSVTAFGKIHKIMGGKTGRLFKHHVNHIGLNMAKQVCFTNIIQLGYTAKMEVYCFYLPILQFHICSLTDVKSS